MSFFVPQKLSYNGSKSYNRRIPLIRQHAYQQHGQGTEEVKLTGKQHF